MNLALPSPPSDKSSRKTKISTIKLVLAFVVILAFMGVEVFVGFAFMPGGRSSIHRNRPHFGFSRTEHPKGFWAAMCMQSVLPITVGAFLLARLLNPRPPKRDSTDGSFGKRNAPPRNVSRESSDTGLGGRSESHLNPRTSQPPPTPFPPGKEESQAAANQAAAGASGTTPAGTAPAETTTAETTTAGTTPGVPPVVRHADAAERPAVLEATFGRGFGKPRRIVVDTRAGTILFERCLVGHGFFDMNSQPSVTMPLDEVLEVHEMRSRGATWLHVITTRGKALVDRSADNYEELGRMLRDVCRNTPAAPLQHQPAMLYAAIGAVLAGVGAGALLAPSSDQIGVTLACMAGGGAVTGALVLLLIPLADKVARGRVAWPLLFAGGGALGGLGMGFLISITTKSMWLALPAWTLVGGLCGLALGWMHFRQVG